MANQVACKICRRQFAIYTCPSCNAPYCSLPCFRSPAHSQCSEPFYKKELETDIRTSHSKSLEEKRRMIDLLQKFEEESAQDDLGASEDEDLATRLSNIDLENANSETLWSLLNEGERSRFLKAVEDPNSKLAQQLLSSDEIEKDQQRPWWEIDDFDEEGKPSTRPDAMVVPSSMVKPTQNSPSLVYNMCAICLAYAFTVRQLAASSLSNISRNGPDHAEAKRVISQLVPFLTERKSTTRFESLSDMIADIRPRFDEITSQTFDVLLGDCVTLLRTFPVTHVQSPASAIDLGLHPHRMPILVLSDLSHLFSGPGANHIAQKLLFYAAQILSMPSRVLHLVSSQLSIEQTGKLTGDPGTNRFIFGLKRLQSMYRHLRNVLDLSIFSGAWRLYSWQHMTPLFWGGGFVAPLR